MHHHPKSFYLFVTLAAVTTLALFTSTYAWLQMRQSVEPTFGVTFSWVYAQELGLDPLETYRALVDDLGVRHIRLPIYWSSVERAQGEYDWFLADKLVRFAEDRGVDLTIVVGMKVPRWPECYVPDWAQMLSESSRHRAVLAFVETSVNRYKDSPAMIRWQIENEPFFPFGRCSTITRAQFKEEVDLVRRLDDRPIQVTVSGELESWLNSAQTADILGISLYRQTWNNFLGYVVYPLTPEYYFFRAQLVAQDVSQVVISELQAEPWFPEPIASRPMIEWYDFFTTEMLEAHVAFARQVGVSEASLWGAEWWYALKEAGDDRLWEAARSIFNAQ